MTNNLSDIENIEQELVQLKHRLEQYLNSLDNLANIQNKFVDLSNKYQEFEKYSHDAQENIAQINETHERFKYRFSELEKGIESRWQQLVNDILNIKKEGKETINNLLNAEEKLNNSFREQEAKLKQEWQEIYQDMSNLRQESNKILEQTLNTKEELIQNLTEVNSIKSDVQITLKQLQELGLDPTNFGRIEKLENQINKFTLDIIKMRKRFQPIQTLLVLTSLTSALAILLVFWKLLLAGS